MQQGKDFPVQGSPPPPPPRVLAAHKDKGRDAETPRLQSLVSISKMISWMFPLHVLKLPHGTPVGLEMNKLSQMNNKQRPQMWVSHGHPPMESLQCRDTVWKGQLFLLWGSADVKKYATRVERAGPGPQEQNKRGTCQGRAEAPLPGPQTAQVHWEADDATRWAESRANASLHRGEPFFQEFQTRLLIVLRELPEAYMHVQPLFLEQARMLIPRSVAVWWCFSFPRPGHCFPLLCHWPRVEGNLTQGGQILQILLHDFPIKSPLAWIQQCPLLLREMYDHLLQGNQALKEDDNQGEAEGGSPAGLQTSQGGLQSLLHGQLRSQSGSIFQVQGGGEGTVIQAMPNPHLPQGSFSYLLVHLKRFLFTTQRERPRRNLRHCSTTWEGDQGGREKFFFSCYLILTPKTTFLSLSIRI